MKIASFLWCSGCHTEHFLVQPISSWGTFPLGTTGASTLCHDHQNCQPAAMQYNQSFSAVTRTCSMCQWEQNEEWMRDSQAKKRFREIRRHSTKRVPSTHYKYWSIQTASLKSKSGIHSFLTFIHKRSLCDTMNTLVSAAFFSLPRRSALGVQSPPVMSQPLPSCPQWGLPGKELRQVEVLNLDCVILVNFTIT